MKQKILPGENKDIIVINNTRETVSYNGKEYGGEEASSAAFMIRIAMQELLGIKEKPGRSSWQKSMLGD